MDVVEERVVLDLIKNCASALSGACLRAIASVLARFSGRARLVLDVAPAGFSERSARGPRLNHEVGTTRWKSSPS
jgi:hypothetical protein